GIPPGTARGLAEIPVARIFGPIPPPRRAPPAPVQTALVEALGAPRPGLHRGKSPPQQLRIHPPGAPVSPGPRFFLLLGPAADVPRSPNAAPPPPATSHSRCAPGSSKVALRSIPEIFRANTLASAARAPHPPGTRASRCLSAWHRLPLPRRGSRECRRPPNCASAPARAIPSAETCIPAAV